MAERGTVKTSTILIGIGKRLRVFHALEEVPPALRRKLVKSTTGANVHNFLIADRRGAQELLKANIRALLEREPDSPAGLVPWLREGGSMTMRFLALHWRAIGGVAAALGLLLSALAVWFWS